MGDVHSRCRRARFAVSVMLAAPLGCVDRDVSVDPLHDMLVADCERRTRCHCASIDDDCDAYAHERAAEIRDAAQSRGSDRFDVACAELMRETAEATCADGGIAYSSADSTIAARAGRCSSFLFHGDRRVGESCEVPSTLPFFDPSNCEADAVCLDLDGTGARCRAWPPDSLGDLCRDGDLDGSCPPDLACVPVGDGKRQCERWTEIGAPCAGVAGDYCEGPPGQWCDPETSTCQARPGPDEPCADPPGFHHERCAAGLYCDARCNYDAYCDDFTCRARRGPGDACDARESCALGLECENGVCRGDEACF